MKYTKTNLQKLEQLFEALDYVVRYEKGNFQSGYCIVEARRIVIINRFFETEGRINTLLDILSRIEIDATKLDEESLRLYQKIFQTTTENVEKNIT